MRVFFYLHTNVEKTIELDYFVTLDCYTCWKIRFVI